MQHPGTDPLTRKRLRSRLVVPGFLLIVLALVLVFVYSNTGIYSSLPGLALVSLLIGLLAIGLYALAIWAYRVRRPGSVPQQDLLASRQPLADGRALPLPTTLEVRATRGKYILVQGGLYTLCYTVITALAAQQSTLSFARFATIFLIALSVGLLFGLLHFYLIGKSLGQVLTADEYGITVVNGQQNMYIDWQSAQFFGVKERRKAGTVGLYELSGGQKVVRWWWLCPTRSLFNFLQPTIPYDEYTRKMADLLSLIEARTHLPLYDLSVRWAQQEMPGMRQEQRK